MLMLVEVAMIASYRGYVTTENKANEWDGKAIMKNSALELRNKTIGTSSGMDNHGRFERPGPRRERHQMFQLLL